MRLKVEIENWKAVVGYEGLYEVSDLGRVRSLDRLMRTGSRLGSYVLAGRILQQYMDRKGYRNIALSLSGSSGRGIRKRFFVHRLVLMAHLRLPNAVETDVNHIDFNPDNNKLANLEWVSHTRNMGHSSTNGRLYGAVARGGRTKLTVEQVAEILAEGSTGLTPQHAIAKRFGIRQQTVSKILNGHAWTFGPAKGVPVSGKVARVRTALNTRLTRLDVKLIRSFGYTKSLADLGAMFGVSRSCIQNIRDNTTWKDVI